MRKDSRSQPAPQSDNVQQRFTAALDALIEQVKRDRSILAAILCGSLSYDTVWAKSDIDLVLITIDDKKTVDAGRALYADGLNVHAMLMPRAEFRKTVEGSIGNSFSHSFLARGRLLYTHDETIADLCLRLQVIGERDTQVQLLAAAAAALPAIYKAHKWFLTRGDLDYSALWILYAATPLAKVEVLSARLLVDREVLPQAMKLNPDFFKLIYADLLNNKKTASAVKGALSAIDGYLRKHAPLLFAPVIDHLREVGEARSATEIEDHFQRNFGISGVTGACEYLSDQGLLGKAPLPVRLTKKSNVDVGELAFFHVAEVPDEF
jgi:predicted nucleotidyltransferase